MLTRMHYLAGRDENMEVAHHVVILNMFPQHSYNKATQEKKFSWTTGDIAQAQRSDPDINSVIARMGESKPKPSPGELLSLSPISRAIWAQHELLELKDNVLRICPKERSKKLKPRIVLPESLVKPAPQRLHDGLEGSNLGQLKTLRKVQARFWRPGLAKAVKDHCTSCLTCAECKPPQENAQGTAPPYSFVLPFPATSR